MKYLLTFLFCAFPAIGMAHATPVAYAPEAFTVVDESEKEVSIRFNEPLEISSANITIYTPHGGKDSSKSTVSLRDTHILSTNLPRGGDGVYTASWRVVSALDGHYTNGAFSFYVGATSSAPDSYKDGTSTTEMDENGRMHSLLGLFLPSTKPLWSITRTDALRTITALDMGEESGVLRFVARDALGQIIESGPPLVVLHNALEGIGPLVVPAKERGGGAYDIPWALFVPNGEWQIAVTWKHEGAYDINTTFRVEYPKEVLAMRGRVVPAQIGIVWIFVMILLPIIILLGVWYTRKHGFSSKSQPPQ
jgi:methionine-rich copper-binding protein CopC